MTPLFPKVDMLKPKFDFVNFWDIPGINDKYVIVETMMGDEFMIPHEAASLSRLLSKLMNIPFTGRDDAPAVSCESFNNPLGPAEPCESLGPIDIEEDTNMTLPIPLNCPFEKDVMEKGQVVEEGDDEADFMERFYNEDFYGRHNYYKNHHSRRAKTRRERRRLHAVPGNGDRGNGDRSRVGKRAWVDPKNNRFIHVTGVLGLVMHVIVKYMYFTLYWRNRLVPEQDVPDFDPGVDEIYSDAVISAASFLGV